MAKRAAKPTKRIDDRRRSGVGDNVAFTTRAGVGGLGTGTRVSNLVSPVLAQHQFTNRVARNRVTRTVKNGKGKKTI
jgi:hypothetical protein